MDFSDFYWQILAGAISANLITGVVIYVAVLRRQGNKTGMTLSKAPGILFGVAGLGLIAFLVLMVFLLNNLSTLGN